MRRLVAALALAFRRLELWLAEEAGRRHGLSYGHLVWKVYDEKLDRITVGCTTCRQLFYDQRAFAQKGD